MFSVLFFTREDFPWSWERTFYSDGEGLFGLDEAWDLDESG